TSPAPARGSRHAIPHDGTQQLAVVRRSRSPRLRQMPTLRREDRTIHFTRDGDGPGVVLVPGLGAGARLFGTLPRRFARAGFTCAAVDPVGLPPSSPLPGEWSFAEAAQDVLAVARALPSPVALVGTSLGGKVALC